MRGHHQSSEHDLRGAPWASARRRSGMPFAKTDGDPSYCIWTFCWLFRSASRELGRTGDRCFVPGRVRCVATCTVCHTRMRAGSRSAPDAWGKARRDAQRTACAPAAGA